MEENTLSTQDRIRNRTELAERLVRARYCVLEAYKQINRAAAMEDTITEEMTGIGQGMLQAAVRAVQDLEDNIDDLAYRFWWYKKDVSTMEMPDDPGELEYRCCGNEIHQMVHKPMIYETAYYRH